MRCPTHKAIIGMIIFLSVVFAVAGQADADSDFKSFYLEIEAGPVWQSMNDVQIPGDSGTEFSFKDLTGTGPYAAGRFSLGWNIRERHGLRLVAAPLRVSGSGTFDEPVSFAGKTFAADASPPRAITNSTPIGSPIAISFSIKPHGASVLAAPCF